MAANVTLSEMDSNTKHGNTFQINMGFFIFYACVLFFLSVAIVIGNGLVIVTLLKYRQLKRPCNYLIVSLSLSDLLFGICFPAYNAGQWSQGSYSEFMASRVPCVSVLVIVTWLEMNSAYHLVALTGTRYIAITRPLHYHTHVTHIRCVMTIAFTWIVTLCLAISMYATSNFTPSKVCKFELVFEENRTYMFTVTTIVIPLVCMVGCYVIIINIARKHIRRRCQESAIFDSRAGRNRVFKRELRSTMVVCFLVGYFAFAWIPLACYIIYTSVCQCYTSPYISMCTRLLVYTNYSVNVFVYAGRIKNFWKYATKNMKCLCHCSTSVNSTTADENESSETKL